MRRPDREVDARDDLDACEVELDSDEEADARDDLDAHGVLAVELIEEVVVLLLELGLQCVMCDTMRLMRMMPVEAGQLVAERMLTRRGSGQVLLLREADRGSRPMP
eukprot:134209-Prymnesium_polylepis.1